MLLILTPHICFASLRRFPGDQVFGVQECDGLIRGAERQGAQGACDTVGGAVVGSAGNLPKETIQNFPAVRQVGGGK